MNEYMGNPCIKTGFVFHDVRTNETLTGDLFFFAGLFQIRGIPPLPVVVDREPDALVDNCIYAQRNGSRLKDTNFGVRVFQPSEEFKAHIAKWYPHLYTKVG